MLSQHGEDKIVADFFGNHIGHFLDIGASSGVALSNTFELGLRNWHGLLVEASPLHFQTLLSNYVNRGGIELLNAAVWTNRQLMKFHYNQWFYSSLVEKNEANLYQAHYWVQTVVAEDLKTILPIADFITVDIEGADLFVFPSLFEAYPMCRLFCVEHAKDEMLKSKWQDLFKKLGLKLFATTAENYLVSR